MEYQLQWQDLSVSILSTVVLDIHPVLPMHLPFDNTPLLVSQIAYPRLFESWDIISYL